MKTAAAKDERDKIGNALKIKPTKTIHLEWMVQNAMLLLWVFSYQYFHWQILSPFSFGVEYLPQSAK